MAILSGGLDPKIRERLVQEQQALETAFSDYERTSSVSSHSYRAECQQVIKTLSQKLLSDLRRYGVMSNTDLEHMASSITARLCKSECLRDDEMLSTRVAKLSLASLDQEIGDLRPPSARLVDHTTTKSYVDEALREFISRKVVGKKAGVPLVEKTISHRESLDPITRIDLRDVPGGNPDFCYELTEIKKADGTERVLRECGPLHRRVTSKIDEGKAAAPGLVTKILDSVSEAIIPSAFAEEVSIPSIGSKDDRSWKRSVYFEEMGHIGEASTDCEKACLKLPPRSKERVNNRETCQMLLRKIVGDATVNLSLLYEMQESNGLDLIGFTAQQVDRINGLQNGALFFAPKEKPYSFDVLNTEDPKAEDYSHISSLLLSQPTVSEEKPKESSLFERIFGKASQ